jgi:hypothetical protein
MNTELMLIVGIVVFVLFILNTVPLNRDCDRGVFWIWFENLATKQPGGRGQASFFPTIL